MRDELDLRLVDVAAFHASQSPVLKAGMSDVVDIIDREASPADAARVAAVIASDFRFSYFGTAAFAVRLLRLDQKLADGIPMNPLRMPERAQHQA